MKTCQTVIIIDQESGNDFRLSLTEEQVRMLKWLDDNSLLPEEVKIYDSTEEPETV